MSACRPFWLTGVVLALVCLGAATRAPAQILVIAATTPATPAGTAAAEDDDFVDEYAATGPQIADPFERVNRTMFKFNGTVYTHVLRPFAHGYEVVVPAVARRGLSSFYRNLHFPVRFAGSLLQGKLGRAATEVGKFALNSTVGLAGFIDVAARYPAMQVPEEDIGQVFATWGIGHGPFLILPILGPSSVRDGIGTIGDYYLTPTHWKYLDHYDRWVAVTLQAGDYITGLPDLLATQDALQKAAVDPYIAFRNAYVQYRDGEVKR